MGSSVKTTKRSATRWTTLKDIAKVAIPAAATMTILVGFQAGYIVLLGIMRYVGGSLPMSEASWLITTAALMVGVLWCIYRIMGIQKSLQTAAVISTTSIAVYMMTFWMSLRPPLMFAIVFVVASTAYLLARHIKRSGVVWGITVILMIFALFGAPRINAYFSAIRYQDTTAEKLQQALGQLNFDVYTPGYTPDGMTTSAPKLTGINSRYHSTYVEYTIGRIEVTQAAKVENQDQLMNFTDNCDIHRLKSTMTTESGVKAGDIEASKSNLSKCALVATTDNGRKIYQWQRGQRALFYTEIGNTNIIFEFDRINKIAYQDSFLPEMVKIINSLEEAPKETIEYGG